MKTSLLIVPLVAVFLGCTAWHQQPTTAPVFSELPSPAQVASSIQTNDASILHVGNVLQVTFSKLPAPVPTFAQLIRDDGTITLIYNEPFQAAGKTAGVLEKEIRDFYVPAYFANLAVSIHISAKTACVYVSGEFRNSGRYAWTNGMRLKDAIDAAGGFTEFANHRIKIIHQDGTTQRYRLRGDWALGLTNNPVLKPLDAIINPRDLL
jgi:protein involved in polysaccharide export with SLBB domain